MWLRTVPALLAVLIALGPLAPQTLAQGFQIREVDGEVAVTLDGFWAQYPVRPGTSVITWREWLLLKLNGFVSDPRLVSFNLAARPVLGQRSWSGIGDTPNGGDQMLNGLGRIVLLGGAPLSFSAWWSRISADQDLQFGARQETDGTDWELEARSSWRPLPARLSYSGRSLQQLFRPNPGVISALDEDRQTLRLSASNSKLRVDVERLDYESRTSDLAFVRTLVDTDHTLRWGRGSRLTSGFLYLNTSGRGAVERLSWRQSARIRHVQSFSSSLGYQLFDATTASDFNRGWSASYLGNWNRRRHFTIAVGGDVRSRSFRLGAQRFARGRSRVASSARLPLGFALGIDGGLGYEFYRQSLSADDGFGTVVDERQVIDASGTFVLNEPLAEPASVVITSEDGTIVFTEGLDYRLVESAGRLEVFALPGGRMTEGTVVLVDYQVRLLAEAEETSWTYSYELRLRKGPFTAYHSRAARNLIENGSPIPSPTFREYDEIAAGIRLAGVGSIGYLSLAADYTRRTQNPGRLSNQMQVKGSWRYAFGPGLMANLTTRYTSRTNGRRFQIFEGTGGGEWRATSRLKLYLRLSAYDWHERAFRSERFFGAGVGGEWLVRQLSMRLSYDRNAWTEGFERTEDRLIAQVTRSF
ncbi:MAG: hypothetical protein JSU87_14080 [Gemmatimonadota bacterium]|nr:MAG: hypothetical protein JSU87_14080 [Gemmatimonadota bacterium]